jgi:prepilin-type N-terminal cleavage/methylation domain-containing protein
MKKAFSLIEVVIAITMLSVVMVTLLQIKSDNIFMISKSDEKAKLNDYALLAIELRTADTKNENLFLDKIYSFEDDDLRRELKDVKVKIKDEKEKSTAIDNELMKINIITYSTTYSIKDDFTKKIYSFKIEL